MHGILHGTQAEAIHHLKRAGESFAVMAATVRAAPTTHCKWPAASSPPRLARQSNRGFP